MKTFRTLAAATLITLAAGSPSRAFDSGEFQIWLDFNAQGKISENLKVRMEQELHFADDAQDLNYHHAGFGLQWTASEHWTLSANYRQAYGEKDENWERESRPHLNATYKWKYQNISLSNRGRLELRIRDDRNDIVRYRNKTTAVFPVEWTRLELRPYVAEEFFVDSDQGSYNQNRLFGGFKTTLHEQITGAFYYMWLSVDRDDLWEDAHVIGFSVSILL